MVVWHRASDTHLVVHRARDSTSEGGRNCACVFVGRLDCSFEADVGATTARNGMHRQSVIFGTVTVHMRWLVVLTRQALQTANSALIKRLYYVFMFGASMTASRETMNRLPSSVLADHCERHRSNNLMRWAHKEHVRLTQPIVRLHHGSDGDCVLAWIPCARANLEMNPHNQMLIVVLHDQFIACLLHHCINTNSFTWSNYRSSCGRWCFESAKILQPKLGNDSIPRSHHITNPFG